MQQLLKKSLQLVQHFIYLKRSSNIKNMKKLFTVSYHGEALNFIKNLEQNVAKEIFKAIEIAQIESDSRAFMKLSNDIWEFRIKCLGNDLRLLAFWMVEKESIVICTHGFICESSKTPIEHIEKAEKIRIDYLRRN